MVELFLSLPFHIQVFIGAIFVLTFAMVVFFNERIASLGPTILTMLGIFGCFFGIAVGLQNFQTTDVQGSVPALLQGIKTAFWVSVAGIFGALILKVRLLVFGPPRSMDEGSSEGATVDDLAKLLQRLNYSLAGKDDSTLLSQLKLMRQENGDGLAALKLSLDDFMRTMADNSADALIQALSDVIRDFNSKLSEQFGENFRQLNSAVRELVTWQDSYRRQMAEMIELQTKSASNMSLATERYSTLVSQGESFSKVADSLRSLMSALEQQRDELTGSLNSLGNLLKSAGEGLPKIEGKILEMTKQIEVGVRNSNDQMTATVRAVTDSLKTSITEMKKILADVADEANRGLNTHMKQLAEKTQNQVVALDKALNDELSKSITTLGEHLATLSKKFVDDYSPLTDKLRQLVQVGSKI